MSEPGQATDKANTDTLRVPVLATSQAEAAMRKALDQIGVELTWSDIATAVRAVAPILMQAGRDQAYAGAHTAYAVKAAPGVPRNPLTWATEEEARQYASLPGDRVVRLLTIVKAEAVPDSHNTQEDA